MSAAELRPYQQGDLDALCGVYAIINGLRWAMRDQPIWLSGIDWGELFHVLLAGAECRIGAVRFAVAGIEPKPLGKLIRLAAEHLEAQHGITIRVSRPLLGLRGVSFARVSAELGALSAAPASAVLLCVMGYLGHWTVLRRVTSTNLELFDSDRLVRLRRANCRMAWEPPRQGTREHILSRRAVFLFAAH